MSNGWKKVEQELNNCIPFCNKSKARSVETNKYALWLQRKELCWCNLSGKNISSTFKAACSYCQTLWTVLISFWYKMYIYLYFWCFYMFLWGFSGDENMSKEILRFNLYFQVFIYSNSCALANKIILVEKECICDVESTICRPQAPCSILMKFVDE